MGSRDFDPSSAADRAHHNAQTYPSKRDQLRAEAAKLEAKLIKEGKVLPVDGRKR